MTQTLFRRLTLGLATASLACLPTAAGAGEPVDVFAFKGTATDIGVQRGPNQIGGIEYRIEGKFEYDGFLDLTRSTVTFHNFLDEVDRPVPLPDGRYAGNGEMVLTIDNADLVCPQEPSDCALIPDISLPTLFSATSSKPIEGKYETPGRYRPPMRVQIKNKGGEYQFNVRLDRGLSPQVLAIHPHPFPADRQFPKLCHVDPLDKSKRSKTDIRTSFTISDGVNPSVTLDFVKAWECSQPGRYHLRSR